MALIVVSRRAGSLWHDPLFVALGLSILLVSLLNSTFKIWYGGHSFGPRYFTEVQAPILILLGASLETSGKRLGVLALCLALIIPYSFFVQIMGTFNDATITWNAFPTNVDQDRSRLWDWTDNPIFAAFERKAVNNQRPASLSRTYRACRILQSTVGTMVRRMVHFAVADTDAADRP